MMKNKLLFTMIITAISLSVSAQNLVINGDFETALGSEWALWNADGAGFPNTGAGAMRIKGTQGSFSQLITVVPGTTYTFSYAGRWLTVPVLPALGWYPGMSLAVVNTGDNANLNTSPTYITTDVYTTVSVDLTMPAGVTEVKIELYRSKETPFFYADDISVTVASALGINEVEELKANVYPNPVSDVLNITASEELVDYTIYNVAGQKVQEGTLNGSVSVSNLLEGVYFIKTTGISGNVYNAKLLVK
jgi:hypothetical protein